MKKATSIYSIYHLNRFNSNIYRLIFDKTGKKEFKSYYKLLAKTSNLIIINYQHIICYSFERLNLYVFDYQHIQFFCECFSWNLQRYLFLIMKRLNLISNQISSTYKYTKIQVQKKDEVATIWLNSPKDLNCLSIILVEDIRTAIQDFNHDKTIKVIVIRSKVPKIFCAGADIKAFTTYDLSQYPNTQHFTNIQNQFRRFNKPVISVVEGRALGGGFQLALLTDIILCSENATFGLPEVNLGIMPGMGGTQILPRIVGQKVAKRMIMTGLSIDAKQAHRLNIAHLLPTQTFQAKVNELITTIASKSQTTLIAISKAVSISQETTLNHGLYHEGSIFQTIFNEKGAKEGIKAFLQKRKPNFKGI